MNLEAPTELPNGLEHLSHTSVDLFLKCPEKWRRRYLEREYETPVGIMVLGRAVHAAENQNYHYMVKAGEPMPTDEVLENFSDSMDAEAQREVDWEKDTPGILKDEGVGLIKVYHQQIVPAMKPTRVEQEFNVRLQPHLKWTIKGFIDVIAAYDDGFQQLDSAPTDIKTVRKAKSQDMVDNDLQGSLYTFATIGDSEKDEDFRIHQLRTLKDGPHANVITTTRTREARMRYLARVAMVARQIESNVRTGDWQGAHPGSWYCGATSCGYWNTCPLVARP